MNPYHPHLLDRRLGVARGILWLTMGVLAAAFFRAQILEHGKYQLQSETNRLRPFHSPPRAASFWTGTAGCWRRTCPATRSRCCRRKR